MSGARSTHGSYTSGGRQRWYCSYHCMRQDERPRLEAARVRAQEQEEKKAVEKRKKTEFERAVEKVERCRARYKQAREKTIDGEAWAALTARERKNASDTASHWLARLTVAEQELEDVRRRRDHEMLQDMQARGEI